MRLVLACRCVYQLKCDKKWPRLRSLAAPRARLACVPNKFPSLEKISPYFLALEDVPGLSDSFLIQRRNQPFPQGAQVSVVVVVSGGRCLKAKARVPCVLGLLGSHCLQSLGGQSEGIFTHIPPPTHTHLRLRICIAAHKQNFILILLTLIQHHKVHFSQILIFLPVRTPDLVSDNRVAALLNSSRHVSSFRSTDPYPREPLLFDCNLHI